MSDRLREAITAAGMAQRYLLAAERLLGPKAGDPNEILLHDPACLLIGQAIELGLGAYLRAHKLKSRGGDHDLVARLDAALVGGLKPPAIFVDVVRGSHPAWERHQHRYPPTDGKYQAYVTPRFALPIVRTEIENILGDLLARLQAADASG